MSPSRLLLIDQSFSPWIQLARLNLVPVVNQRCSPQIPLARLLLPRRSGSRVTGTTILEELDSEDEHVSDHASHRRMEEEGEVSDL